MAWQFQAGVKGAGWPTLSRFRFPQASGPLQKRAKLARPGWTARAGARAPGVARARETDGAGLPARAARSGWGQHGPGHPAGHSRLLPRYFGRASLNICMATLSMIGAL